jgi:glucose dehydrogenase
MTNSDVTRREFMEAAVVTSGALLGKQLIPGVTSSAAAQNAEAAAMGWLSYGGDKANSKYSPIDQVGGDNFSGLQVVWTWRSAEEEPRARPPHIRKQLTRNNSDATRP